MAEVLIPLKRFLRSKGWKPGDEFDAFAIWTAPEQDDQNKEIKLSLPANSEFVDTLALCDKALELLSSVYDEPKDGLRRAIESLGYDSLSQRINLDSNENSIPLEVASNLIKNLEKIISYAACLEDDIQPFFHKSKKIGKQTVNKCRFAHTFPGSFGIQLQMPIRPPATSASDTKLPFERRVMQRIGQGFIDIETAVRNADASILLSRYDKGFNANIYETLQDLLTICPAGKSEFSFLWSTEYSLPHELSKHRAFRLSSGDVSPLIETAAKELRKCFESEDTLIFGKIIQLHSDTDLPEYEDELDLGDEESRRLMVISWESELGKLTKIRVALSEAEHPQACDAYKKGLNVSVQGRPEKRGKFFHLSAPRDFKIISNT